MINKTEEWLYKKAKEVDSELELQDLYTSKFSFGGRWVMDLLEDYHKEQLNIGGVGSSLPSKLEVDFDGHLLAEIEMRDKNLKVLRAVNGWGDIVDCKKVKVVTK